MKKELVHEQHIFKKSKRHLLRDGFVSGIGWAFGVTIGFALVSTLLVFVFDQAGGIPLIGSWVASIVHATQDALLKRSIIVPQ